ncbi:MAG: hypothetical protein K2W95_29525 [Candidatus Obscuribacterales bacterium]|nr:hypothetical protein [Candidatus Obscuribacterales bacterium]
MSWWDKHKPKKEVEFPIVVTLIPQKLAVTIHLHEIDVCGQSLSCWSYVSSGFSSVGQKEIVFTLKRELREEVLRYPGAPLDFFRQIYPLACEGQYVDSGGFTGLAPGFLAPHLGGVLYEKSNLRIANAELPPDLLTAIVVTPEEFAAAYDFGNLRVLTLLGDQSRYYPFPFWIDRRRAGTVSNASIAQMKQGLPGRLHYLLMNDCSAIAHQRELLQVYLDQRHACYFRSFIDEIPPECTAFAFQLCLDATANCCLVWQPPGAASPRAIADSAMAGGSPPGTESAIPSEALMGGAFLSIFMQETENTWGTAEDGFAVALDAKSSAEVKFALISVQNAKISMRQQRQAFEIIWR